eukprot:3759899-Pyramimonas_sp.AAC.1
MDIDGQPFYVRAQEDHHGILYRLRKAKARRAVPPWPVLREAWLLAVAKPKRCERSGPFSAATPTTTLYY